MSARAEPHTLDMCLRGCGRECGALWYSVRGVEIRGHQWKTGSAKSHPIVQLTRIEFTYGVITANKCTWMPLIQKVYSSYSEFGAPVFPNFLKIAGFQKFRINFLLGFQLFRLSCYESFWPYTTYFCLFLKNKKSFMHQNSPQNWLTVLN